MQQNRVRFMSLQLPAYETWLMERPGICPGLNTVPRPEMRKNSADSEKIACGMHRSGLSLTIERIVPGLAVARENAEPGI